MKRALLLIVATTLAACSSSSNPCQTTQTPLDFGDCADLADAGGGPVLGALTITPAQRTACEASCTSSSDQTAVTGAFACLNAIPADAGPCTAASESMWETKVAGQAIGCETALQQSASMACVNAVTSMPDAG